MKQICAPAKDGPTFASIQITAASRSEPGRLQVYTAFHDLEYSAFIDITLFINAKINA